jgi:hypothetical protein
MPSKIQRTAKSQNTKSQNGFSLQPTIIVALIGLVGVIVTGYFSYISSSRSTEIIIEATKTAKFELTKPIEAQSSQAQENSILDVQIPTSYLSSGLGSPIVPDAIDINAPNAIEEINKAIKSDEILNWSIAPDAWMGFSAIIENKSSDNKWIRLDKFVKINIDVLSTTPKDVITIDRTWGQGGGSYYWFSPDIDLIGNYSSYSKTVYVSGDNAFDYYSLQPGEFTEFMFTFNCKQPGTYKISLEIPYRYENKNDVYLYKITPLLICPRKHTYIKVNADLDHTVINFDYSIPIEWNGSEYIRKDAIP